MGVYWSLEGEGLVCKGGQKSMYDRCLTLVSIKLSTFFSVPVSTMGCSYSVCRDH